MAPKIAANLISLALTAASACAARADDVADFYKGKTLTILIGGTAGASYDTQGRLRLYTRYGTGPQALASDMQLLLQQG